MNRDFDAPNAGLELYSYRKARALGANEGNKSLNHSVPFPCGFVHVSYAWFGLPQGFKPWIATMLQRSGGLKSSKETIGVRDVLNLGKTLPRGPRPSRDFSKRLWERRCLATGSIQGSLFAHHETKLPFQYKAIAQDFISRRYLACQIIQVWDDLHRFNDDTLCIIVMIAW